MTLEDNLYVKAVGVTFNNKDGESRQAILKEFNDVYGDHVSFLDIRLKRYTFQGKPAFHVVLEDKIIGNLPADLAEQVAEYRAEGYRITPRDPKIIGGLIEDWDAFYDSENEDDEFDVELKEVNWGLSFYLDVDYPVKDEPTYSYNPKTAGKKKSETSTNATTRQATGKSNYTYNPNQQYTRKKSTTNFKHHIWKLIVGFLCLYWSSQLFMYSSAAFLIFGLLGGGLIFWWLLWDVYPKDKNKKEKEKSDHRKGPEL